jgi:hypothetical protein
MTVAPVSNIPISVDYTGRDYYSLREQLIARIQTRIPNWTATDPADFGVALVEAFSYMGDLIAYYIDRTANEAFIETATQRDTLLNIAQGYGYIPAGYRQSYIDLTFSNTSESSITIPEGSVVSAQITSGDVTETVYFTTLSDAVIPAAVDESPGTYVISATEGRSVTLVSANTNAYGELIGVSDGNPNMSFELGETPVVDGSVEIYVQDGDVYSKWNQVQHIMDYNPTDTVYTVTSDENNVVSINFGDGVSGVIPTIYSEIRAKYIVGGGGIGNVGIATIDTIEYVTGLSEAQVTALQSSLTVTNEVAAIGGSDPETNDQIRVSAPASLRALNRAVSLQDFKDLSLSVTGVGKTGATSGVWTSVTVYIAPSRTANDTDQSPGLDDTDTPTSEWNNLATNVEQFLQEKTLIGTTVSVQPPVYVDCVMEIQYSKLQQYTAAEVELNIKQMIVLAYGYSNLSFEQTIYPQDIEYSLQQVLGVKTAKVLALHRVGGSGLNTLTGAPNEIFRFQETNLSLVEA